MVTASPTSPYHSGPAEVCASIIRKQRRGQIPKRPAACRLRSSVGSCWHAKYGVARASPRSFIVSQPPCHPPLPNISGHFAYLPLSPLTPCHHASPALIGPHCFLVPFCPFRPCSHCPPRHPRFAIPRSVAQFAGLSHLALLLPPYPLLPG